MAKQAVAPNTRVKSPPDVRLASSWEQARPSAATYILCPALERFAGKDSVWLSVLACHDANDLLLSAVPVAKQSRPNLFAGMFGADVLRTSTQLIRALKARGIVGVINLPSVSFIDGQSGDFLNGMGLGIDKEIGFLELCARAGLRIAAVVDCEGAAQRCAAIGAEFLVAHGGAPTRAQPDPSIEAARTIAAFVQQHGTPVVPISSLQSPGTTR